MRRLFHICLIVFASLASAEFSQHFTRFLSANYGEGVLTILERRDLDGWTDGSFGGRREANETIHRRPVIFVHGALLTASSFRGTMLFFGRHGYEDSELYATTYETDFQRAFLDVDLSCRKIKQLRIFIEAVSKYASSKVDIISWSLGTIITRKAILGGTCLDTGEELGESLTDLVETFIAVGGITYGFEDCPRNRTACRNTASINCRSQLLLELNSQPHRYEANFSYGLFALNDRILSSKCCNHTCGVLRNAVLSIGLAHYDHLSILKETSDVQLALLQHPTLADINASSSQSLNQSSYSAYTINLLHRWINYLSIGDEQKMFHFH